MTTEKLGENTLGYVNKSGSYVSITVHNIQKIKYGRWRKHINTRDNNHTFWVREIKTQDENGNTTTIGMFSNTKPKGE